ncbi:MAG: flagellar hook basal-body protein [Bryobacteraceae bacterium]|nr:flagellar hook basal-body protein [Bryobacteraceae bacterium]
MDVLTSAAASGMRARIETLDLLANNIANAGTAGYKADREFYNLYVSPDAVEGSLPSARLPLVEGRWTDYSQGTLRHTSNPLDLSLSGEGFFVVEGQNGPLFTRNGTFKLSREGIVEAPGGHRVATLSGRPLRIDSSRPVEITKEGVVLQDGAEVDRLRVVQFDRPQQLSKSGSTYFSWAGPASGVSPARAEVLQGRLEEANAGSAEAAVRMINVLRQFEMLQKAVTLGGEMNRKAVEEVGKV